MKKRKINILLNINKIQYLVFEIKEAYGVFNELFLLKKSSNLFIYWEGKERRRNCPSIHLILKQ